MYLYSERLFHSGFLKFRITIRFFNQAYVEISIRPFIHFYQSPGRAILHHSNARLVKRWLAIKLDKDFMKIHIGVRAD